MSEQLQLRRGSGAQVAAFRGAPGEVVVDSTNNRIVVQDGATLGGFAAAKLNEVLLVSGGSATALGIGTPVDPGNPLSVKASSALFTALSTDFRVVLNKTAPGNTASFLYQDGFSGRAEIGLTGDDNFHFKVSPNGSTWNTGILIDATTGAVTFGNARTAVNDAAYTALVTDRTIAYTAITAARAVALPPASAFPAGVTLTVVDESGSCSPTNAIALSAAGSDTIAGVGSLVISRAYGFAALESNGSSKWTPVEQPGALAVMNSGSVNNSASGSGAFVNHTPGFALPANYLQNGKAVRISAAFRMTSGSAPPTISFALKAGSTVLAAIGAVTPTANLTNFQFGLTFILQAIAAPGASANCECCVFGNTNGGGGAAGAMSATAMPVAVATNAAITLQMASEWSAAGTGANSCTLSQFIVEAIN
jgi:hypothetical protein